MARRYRTECRDTPLCATSERRVCRGQQAFPGRSGQLGDHLLTSAPGRSRTDTGDPFRGPASSLGLRGLGNNTPERLSDSRAAELIQNVSPGGSFSIFTWTPNAKRNHFDYVRRRLLTERYRLTSMRRGRTQASLQASSPEDRVQHARGDPASERVLLTRVITADQDQVAAGSGAGQRDLCTVPEGWPGPGRRVARIAQYRPQRLPGVPAQADDDAKRSAPQADLRGQPGCAGVALGHGGLVGRRGAPDRGPDPGVQQALAVPRPDAVRLGRQAAAMKRGEQHVSAPVPGEDPPGPVPAVGGRRQAHDQDARVLVTPAGDRAPPVRFVAVRPALDPG